MTDFEHSRYFAPRNWIGVVTASGFLTTGLLAVALDSSVTNAPDNSYTNSPANAPDGSATNATAATFEKKSLKLRIGPFDLHPRLVTGLTYDDNILYSTANTEADAIWTVQPALQAVAGDDAALIAYRDQGYDVLNLSPGSIIIQRPEVWPGKLFILDYGPRFQIFDKYTVNNSIDQLGTLNLLWPMSKLILGFRQDYSSQKTTIIEVGQRAEANPFPPRFPPTTSSATRHPWKAISGGSASDTISRD